MLASDGGHLDIIYILVEHGANVNTATTVTQLLARYATNAFSECKRCISAVILISWVD